MTALPLLSGLSLALLLALWTFPSTTTTLLIFTLVSLGLSRSHWTPWTRMALPGIWIPICSPTLINESFLQPKLSMTPTVVLSSQKKFYPDVGTSAWQQRPGPFAQLLRRVFARSIILFNDGSKPNETSYDTHQKTLRFIRTP